MTKTIIKILNLYAGLGGNRELWKDVYVTSVENDPVIAGKYSDLFPGDNIIIDDAHQYLLEHFQEFDFIWASPPCPTHSTIRKICKNGDKPQNKPVYPDMRLYQEIIFLDGYFKGPWVVENVFPWYSPLIPFKRIGRHCFWANFFISKINIPDQNVQDQEILFRNKVNPILGEHILKCAFKIKQTRLL